jgi:RimJ/RimL family protein N-acetyltransferase
VQHARTARLVIRDWAEADAPAALGIYGRQEVTRWLGAPPMQPVESLPAMAARLERMIARNAERPGFGLWPVERIADGAVVGAVLLVPVQLSDGQPAEPGSRPEIEVGWHFNPDHWGNGYATEAARAIIGLAFSTGLDRVIAVVYPGNSSSLAVCRRLGMTHQGLTNRYYNCALELFSITAGQGAEVPVLP